MVDQNTSKFTPKESYELFREQIQHEDSLVNQRLSWFLNAQGFLAVGFAAVGSLHPQSGQQPNTPDLQQILTLSTLAALGFALSVLTCSSVAAAHRSLRRLQ